MSETQLEACIKIVCSQTNYTREKAEEKLKEFNNDFIKVIKQYLNPNFDKPKKERKIKKNQMNQEIISQIRKFKDKQCENYNRSRDYKKELKKLYERHLETQNSKHETNEIIDLNDNIKIEEKN
jgi:hypothetical protein